MEKIDEQTVKLMRLVANKLTKNIAENTSIANVREAVTMHHIGNGELVQIQIIVTRDKQDLLDDFETVEMTNL